MTDPQAQTPGTAPAARHGVPAYEAVLLLGVALALCATNPTDLVARGPVGWLLTAAVLLAAVWAAPVIARRPAVDTVHWAGQLARHRNTVFAVGCVIIAAFSDPPVWLTAVDAALLLAYLLAVDALAAGPIGVRQLRRGVAPLSALAAVAVVLLGAQSPVDSGAIWGRVLAALAVAAAASAAGAALWLKRSSTQASRPPADTRTRGPKHL